MSRRVRVVVLLVLAGAGLAVHLLSDDAGRPPDGTDGTPLRPWEMLGCWEVRLTSWTATPTPAVADSGSAPGGGSSRARGEPGPGRRSAGEAAESPLPAPAALPRTLRPPTAVMLLPDSVDLWGRVLDSYRALAIEEGRPLRAVVGDAARTARALRWFIARDTLWLIWTEDATRAGVALVRHEDHLRGSARGLADSADVSAGAEAWPVNCATGQRESPAPWRQR